MVPRLDVRQRHAGQIAVRLPLPVHTALAGHRIASTRFTFADFGIAQPRVPVVLSVADTIGLEYSFTLVRDR
jgi:hypothetical protein